MIVFREDAKADGIFQYLMPDLTPLIDILFILLVFFLLSIAPQVRILDLQLPVSDHAAYTAHEPQLLLEITPSDYAVGGNRMATLNEMEASLLRIISKHPDLPVVLAADRHVSVQKLLLVLSTLQTQGISAASIMLRAEGGKQSQ